jgi:hypothetical protein
MNPHDFPSLKRNGRIGEVYIIALRAPPDFDSKKPDPLGFLGAIPLKECAMDDPRVNRYRVYQWSDKTRFEKAGWRWLEDFETQAAAEEYAAEQEEQWSRREMY